MPPVAPHPPDLFAPGQKHLVLLAHHDDELPYAGLLQRMGPEVRIVWLTNSDGLAHLDGEDPEAYGHARYQESLAALAHLGLSEDHVHLLGHSEYALYDLFAKMVRGETGPGADGRPAAPSVDPAVPSRFLEMADEVERIAREAAPDVLWTLAYQGGHPEHDLMHLYAARFHRRLARETGRPLPFFELPAYELGIVPLRFKPWRRAPVHEVRLADAEFARKRAMFDAYPTQWRILRDFERLIRVYGVLSTLRLRPFSFADFGKREEFAPVPPDRDWTRSSHLHPKLDYPGDDYRGTPIRFEKTLAPIARALGLNG